MSIGANQFSSDSAVVWLEIQKAEVYLSGNVSVKKEEAARAVDFGEAVIEEGRSMVVWFGVSGEVFVTAEKRDFGPSWLRALQEGSCFIGSRGAWAEVFGSAGGVGS